MTTAELKQQLWHTMDGEQGKLIQLCCDLIAINSENPPGHMEEVTAFICQYLDGHSVAYEVLRPQPDKPNIIARFGRAGGKTLLLNGHSDVVPVGDRAKWHFDPFCGKVENGKILGRGTSDMKGGLAGLLYAAGLMQQEQVALDGEVILTIVPDEEISGVHGTRWLMEDYGLRGDACLVAEPTVIGNCEIGQRGSLWLKITAAGITAHGSLSPYAGDNAIVKLMRVIDALQEIRQLEAHYPAEIAPVMAASKAMAAEKTGKPAAAAVLDHITINVGTIQGGIKTNVVPDHAQAEIDIRIPIGITSKQILDQLNDIIARLGVTGITYEHSWRSEPNYTDANAAIVDAVADNVRAVNGVELSRTYQWASSDARYFRYAGIPTLQYGPSNTEGIHSYNETVEVRDVIDAAKVYVGTIVDYLAGHKG